jgi:hypothetical protein
MFQKFIILRNILFGWGCVAGFFFLIAEVYIWRKTKVNMWKVWWQTDTSNIKTERRFAQEIKQFPRLNFLYQVIKWTTPIVALGVVGYSLFLAYSGNTFGH